MAARIQIEVDVNSAEFEQFKSSFKSYTDALSKAPAQWAKVSQASRETANENAKATKAVGEYAEHAEKSNKFVGALRQHSEVINRTWINITQSTRNMAGHITSATKSLLQWSGITGLIGGVAGYATVQGIMNLMNTASSGRATAMGLGTNYGKWKSFTTNYARLGDMESFLNRLNINKSTVEGRSGLYALGFKDPDIAKGTPELGSKLITRLKKFVDNTPDEILGNRLRQYRLDQYTSPEDALLLKRMKAGEVAQLAEGYHKDVKNKTYDVNEQDLKKWQDLKTKMESAGNQIAKVFIEGLVPVAEKLGNFADWSSSKLDGLEKLPEMVEAKWKSFGDFIANAKWEPWVVDFFVGVRDITRALWNYLLKGVMDFARWIGVDVSPDETPNMAPGAGGDASAGDGGFGAAVKRAKEGEGGGGSKGPGELPKSGWWTAERMGHAVEYLKSRGVSELGAKALVSRWAFVEASKGPGDSNAVGGGHYGIAQWGQARGGADMAHASFDEQLKHAADELDSSEKAAKDLLNSARTSGEAARGASAFERAEGYNAQSHMDIGYSKTERGIAEVENRIKGAHKAEPPRSSKPSDVMGSEGRRGGDSMMSSTHTTVTVNHAPGNDPHISAAAMAGNGQ
jgi:hypothetical protein